jgi:hypothetical protein
MSLHVDEQFLAAVAAALGETIELVRRRGFHIERTTRDSEPRPARSAKRHADDDIVDLAAYGVDWDLADDARLCRRPRRKVWRRRNRKAA